MTKKQASLLVAAGAILYAPAYACHTILIWTCCMAIFLAFLLKLQIQTMLNDTKNIQDITQERHFIIKRYFLIMIPIAFMAITGPITVTYFLPHDLTQQLSSIFGAQNLDLDTRFYTHLVVKLDSLQFVKAPAHTPLTPFQLLPYICLYLSLAFAATTAVLCFGQINVITKKLARFSWDGIDMRRLNAITAHNKVNANAGPIVFGIAWVCEFYLMERALNPSTLYGEFLSLVSACFYAIFLGPLTWVIFPLMVFVILFDPTRTVKAENES